MGTEGSVKLRPTGIEILPFGHYPADSQANSSLDAALKNALPNPEQLIFPMLPVRQVFSDERGERYIVMPTTHGAPTALPYMTGSALDTDKDNIRQGGFIPQEKLTGSLPAASENPPANALDWLFQQLHDTLAIKKPENPPEPPKADLITNFISQIGLRFKPFAEKVAEGKSQEAINEFIAPFHWLVDQHVRDGVEAQPLKTVLSHTPELLNKLEAVSKLREALANTATDVMLDTSLRALSREWKVDDNSSLSERFVHDSLLQAVGKIKDYAASQIKNQIIGQPGKLDELNIENLTAGAAGMAADVMLDLGFKELGKAWKVDDKSSAFEQVAHKFGMKAIGSITGKVKEEIKNKIKELLGVAGDKPKPVKSDSSSSLLLAARITSTDDKNDDIVTGLMSVLVEGQPIARVGDLLKKSKKIIVEGSATVLAGGAAVSRLTCKTAVPSQIKTGALSVFIGGPSSHIPPPIVLFGGAAGGAGSGPTGGGGMCSLEGESNKKGFDSLQHMLGLEDKSQAVNNDVIAVGIDGTGSAAYRNEPGSVPSHVENIVNDYKINPGNRLYLDGPGGISTRTPISPENSDIEQAAYAHIEARLCDNPDAVVDLYGHSRGGHIVMTLAHRLNEEGILCEYGDGYGYSREVDIRFMGLYDPVDMAIGYGRGDGIPDNVQNSVVIAAPESGPDGYDQSRDYFRRPDANPDNPSLTHYNRYEMRGTHAAIGGAAWTGDHPDGHSYNNDVFISTISDQAIREAATAVGAPVDLKDIYQYQHPEPPEQRPS